MENLKLEKVCKKYGKFTALRNLSLDIKPGIFGLLGPNGAGKTTLMRILTTLLPATSGKISYDSLYWNKPDEVRKLIGYLPQKFSLYKHIKVKEVLNHIAILKGLEKNRAKEVDSVLEKVHLKEEKNKKVGHLSGGMVRRLGIAQAILGNPKILIVDEPTAGLDPEERVRFRELLTRVGEDSIIIVSTHIVEDIEVTCDHAAILNNGELLAYGDLNSLRASAKGKVWEHYLPRESFHSVSQNNCYVVSAHRVEDNYKVRLLTDNPPDNAKPLEPSLEDSYLYLVRSA